MRKIVEKKIVWEGKEKTVRLGGKKKGNYERIKQSKRKERKRERRLKGKEKLDWKVGESKKKVWQEEEN